MQCRVCMKAKCNILVDMSVADTDEGQTLFDYFNDCTQLQASASDSFPKTLCKICTRKLRIAYSFRKCALESNDMFEKINTQSSVSIGDIEDYTEDPLEIEFSDALEVVKQPDRKSPLVDEGCDQLLKKSHNAAVSSFEGEYVYESALINETTIVEQSQADMAEDSYEEKSFPGFEEWEADTVDYVSKYYKQTKRLNNCSTNEIPAPFAIEEVEILQNSQIHRKTCNTSSGCLSAFKKHGEENRNTSTTVFNIPDDYQTRIKKSIGTKRYDSDIGMDETDRIEIEIETTKLECLYCKQIYSSDFELQGHVKKHLFKCRFCSKICTDVCRYYRHIKRLHNCSEIEVPATQVVMEGVEVNEDKRINCKACNVTYSTIAAYRRHLLRKHDSENSEGEMPFDDFHTVEKVCHGQRNFHGTISYEDKDIEKHDCRETKCKICVNATSENSLSINRFSQYERNVQESSVENLQEKVDSRNLKEKEKFLCSYCSRVLSSKRAVEIHEQKQHLNIEPDLKECSFCQKKFNKIYLRKHIENVHIGERKFKCDICGNMYKTNDNVMRHRLLHTKDRNYPCTVCDKRFTEKSELKVHMRLHTGEKPYACHLCDRRFRIRVHLTYHLQQHARIKHNCNICGKEFKHGKSLRNHLYLHTDIMPYRCSVCGYGSVKRDYFVKHMLHKHDRTMTVDELFVIFQANTGRSPYVKVVDDSDMNEELSMSMS